MPANPTALHRANLAGAGRLEEAEEPIGVVVVVNEEIVRHAHSTMSPNAQQRDAHPREDHRPGVGKEEDGQNAQPRHAQHLLPVANWPVTNLKGLGANEVHVSPGRANGIEHDQGHRMVEDEKGKDCHCEQDVVDLHITKTVGSRGVNARF